MPTADAGRHRRRSWLHRGHRLWTPLNGDDPSVTIGIFTEATDEPPTPVLTLSPAMAVRLARELLGAATAASHLGELPTGQRHRAVSRDNDEMPVTVMCTRPASSPMTTFESVDAALAFAQQFPCTASGCIGVHIVAANVRGRVRTASFTQGGTDGR